MHTERMARQEDKFVAIRILMCIVTVCFLLPMVQAQTLGKEHIAAYETFIQGFETDDAKNANAICFVEQVTLAQPETWGQADTLLYCLNALSDPAFPETEMDRVSFTLSCESGVLEDLDAQQKSMLLSPRACGSSAQRMAEPIITHGEMKCALKPYCDWVSKDFPESKQMCLEQYGRCANEPGDMILRQRDQCWSWRFQLMQFDKPGVGIEAGSQCFRARSEALASSELSVPRTWQEQVAQDAAADSPDEFNMGGLDF